ncbi:Uncharacterised protein [Bergeyella zoohelcum]|uniref:Uncharacterized protein n=1 Tax=Bergeyella zoohelcum TaxID=1015 RepID=A0A7Z9CFY5_9FLAO|nr:Uncharacterised protein [Bergeyella zoohelcum]
MRNVEFNKFHHFGYFAKVLVLWQSALKANKAQEI